jgi:hypothetical protein
MAINIATESVLTFRAAIKLLPRRRRGRSVNVATMYRWSQRGCRGVRLETIQVGGTRCTSIEAVQRFFEALSADADCPGAVNTSKSDLQAVLRECEQAGI